MQRATTAIGPSGAGAISRDRQDYLRQIKAPGVAPAPARGTTPRSSWKRGTGASDPTAPSAPAGSVDLTPGGPPRTEKRSFGPGDVSSLDYLGHFSRDDIMAKGHNVGAKKLGKPPVVKAVATRGFRKLPGSASPQQGHAQYGTMSEAALGLRPTRAQRQQDAKVKASMTRAGNRVMLQDPFPLRSTGSSPGAVNVAGGKMPPTKPDKAMAIRHHEDSIRYNKRHMVDHERAMEKHERELAQVRRKKIR